MRLRNVKDKDILLSNCSYLINDPINHKGKWQSVFKTNNPIHIELGMGKGDFIYQMAINNPHINFIGIEKYSGVIAKAIKKHPQSLPNLRIINTDALELANIFEKEISLIYLNFSDPWPKKKHTERRLTSLNFLKIYDKIFKKTNNIIMKTDNLNLFASSIVNLSTYGYILKDICFDLANSSIPNVLTEYERKFHEQGIKINYLVAEK